MLETIKQHLVGQPYLVPFTLSLVLFVVYVCNSGRSLSKTAKAPRVSYLLPWIGSGMVMGKNPDAFFERARSQLGPVFKVKAMGQEHTYVTSPELISAIYRDSKTFEFTPIRLAMAAKIFGMSHAAAYSPFMMDVYLPMHHRAFSPKSVVTLLQRYTDCANECILKTLETFDGKRTPLVPFLIPSAYSSSALVLFGRSFDANKSLPLFRGFDDYFHFIAAGVPRFMMPKPFRARDQLTRVLEKYIRAPHEDSCELIQTLESEAKNAGWTDRDIASSFGAELWALEANALWAAYWVIALELQKPQGLAPLTAEIDDSRTEWTTTHPGEPLKTNLHQWLSAASLPLLTSTIQEVLRVATSVFPIRLVKEPVEFAGYHFDAGERIICATRAVHLDEEIHPRANEFVSERYLDNERKFSKNGKAVLNHTMPFGGGVSMCEGRHFAMGELKIYIALILTNVTIELDPESTVRPKFYSARMGTGVIPPVGDLDVKIRRRSVF